MAGEFGDLVGLDYSGWYPEFDPTGILDLSAFSSIDPSQAGMFYDTLTGQYVTAAQAAILDPEFAQTAYNNMNFGQDPMWEGPGGVTGQTDPWSGGGGVTQGGNGGAGTNLPGLGTTPGTPNAPQNSSNSGWTMRDLAQLGGLLAGLGGAGAGLAGIVQGQLGGSQRATTTRATTPGPMTPEQNFLQGILQNAGMQGLAEYGGLGMQQYNMLSALPGMAPSPDGALNSMLTANALGMAGGGLPALSPELQARLGDIYGARTLDIERYLDQQARDVRDQMNNQGWEGNFGDVLRQGPGQALFAPALAEAVRQRGLLAGQQAQAEINLAQALPTQAAALGQGVWGQNLAANRNLQDIAGLYNQAMAGRTGIPQNLYNMQNQVRGTTQNETRTGPPPSLYDAFQQLGPVLGSAAGTLYAYGQQQPQQLIGGNGGNAIDPTARIYG